MNTETETTGDFVTENTLMALAGGVTDIVDLTAGIATAFITAQGTRLSVEDLPNVLSTIHTALSGLGAEPATVEAPVEAVEKPTPAQIRKSITPDALISFVDGKGYKTLKRHLTKHDLTIETYREKFGLPADYPSTAASYSAARSALAKKMGLGNQKAA